MRKIFEKFPLMDKADDGTGEGSGAGSADVTQSGLSAEQADALIEAVRGEVTQATEKLTTELQAVKTENAELKGKLEGISTQHQSQRNRMFGGTGTFGVRDGEDSMNSRPYSFQRAVGMAMNYRGFEAQNCKHEKRVSDILYQAYDKLGFSGGPNSILVPFGAKMLPPEVLQELAKDFGDFGFFCTQALHGATAGGMAELGGRANVHQNLVRQALSIYDDLEGGVFTDSGNMGEMIELVRNMEVMTQVGATNVTLPTNGTISFPKQTGAATGYWVGEGAAITASNQTTGRLDLVAKKAAAMTTLPNELVRFGSPDAEAFVRADIARVLALLVDLACLEGAGTTTQPRGIIKHSGIVTHSSSVTAATDGDTLNPETPASMIADVEENNHDPERDGFTWVMRAKMWKNIRLRRAGSGYAADDGNGEWLFDVNRGDISNGAPERLEGYKVVKSSQVSAAREKGSSSDLTYVLGGIFKHLLIARAGVLEFATSTQGDTAFANDQTKLRAIQHVDCGLRHENAFVWCDNIDMDLPA